MYEPNALPSREHVLIHMQFPGKSAYSAVLDAIAPTAGLKVTQAMVLVRSLPLHPEIAPDIPEVFLDEKEALDRNW